MPNDTVATFGMTAFLNINYRSPAKAGRTYIIRSRVDRVDGRKQFMNGKMTDATTDTLVADATCLFVRPRPKA